MPMYTVKNIVWDTDGDDQEQMGLPAEAEIWAEDYADVADELSDEYGWCIYSLDAEEIDAGPDPMSLAKAEREDRLTD